MTQRRPEMAGTGGTKNNTKAFPERVLLKERARKRAELTEARRLARRVKAEGHHKAGNAHFRQGEYREAIAEFEVAIQINGPSALYFSNMAAAWLKLKEYDFAEQCANTALTLDPQFTKARFRRGQARKGGLQLAAACIDFETVLMQEPDSTETKRAHDEIVVLMAERNENNFGVADSDLCGPSINEPKIELESVSDSSDWHHEGNGYPCPYYNNEGCARGVECEFSHAPDHTGKSVRDCLGRNVCVRFLLGDCFGRCVFSHDKSYLPSGRWWESEEKRAEVQKMSTWTDHPGTLSKCITGIDGRMEWKPNHTATTEEAFVWKDSIIKLEGLGDFADEDLKFANFVSRVGATMPWGWPGRERHSDWHDDPEEDDSEEGEEQISHGGFEVNPADVCPCDGLPWGPWFGRYFTEDDDYDICVDVHPL